MIVKVRSAEIQDRGKIERILAKVNVFSLEEIKVALKVIDSYLKNLYHFKK
jgi:hypothetical protein